MKLYRISLAEFSTEIKVREYEVEKETEKLLIYSNGSRYRKIELDTITEGMFKTSRRIATTNKDNLEKYSHELIDLIIRNMQKKIDDLKINIEKIDAIKSYSIIEEN